MRKTRLLDALSSPGSLAAQRPGLVTAEQVHESANRAR